MMNKNGGGKPPGIVPNFRREVFGFSSLSILLAVGVLGVWGGLFFLFLIYAFYQVEEVLLLSETLFFHVFQVCS